MPISLQHAHIGTRYRVVAVDGPAQSTQRVRELGMVVGAFCKVIRRSPFGGPIEVALDQRRLGLRLTGLSVLVEADNDGKSLESTLEQGALAHAADCTMESVSVTETHQV